MIMDYGRQSIPVDNWTPEGFDTFKRTIEAAKEFDKVTGQPDCEMVEKMEWMKEVEKRLERIESEIYRKLYDK